MRKSLNRGIVLVAIAAVALLSIGLLCYQTLLMQNRLSNQVRELNERLYATYDTHGAVPGNPGRTMAAMKILYKTIETYRQLHQGATPPNATALVEELYNNPHAYGFANLNEVDDVIHNPDNRYSDMWALTQNGPTSAGHPESICPFSVTNIRPNGMPIGGAKDPGTRDVLMYTDLYYHANQHYLRPNHSKSDMKPVGFWLVLWDDGQVQQVPYDQVLYVPTTGSDFTYGFPGQAGVPASALSYHAFFKSALSPIASQ